MSRHRIVRSMNYSDEYDGYDDVYGHSVEDDYSMSPSDAAFMYDRSSRQPAQFSAFLTTEEDILEEDESGHSGATRKKSFEKPLLSDVDEARLRSCRDEVQSVVGDSVADSVLDETILHCDFDVTRTLNALLESPQKKSTADSPSHPDPTISKPRSSVKHDGKDLANTLSNIEDDNFKKCEAPLASKKIEKRIEPTLLQKFRSQCISETLNDENNGKLLNERTFSFPSSKFSSLKALMMKHKQSSASRRKCVGLDERDGKCDEVTEDSNRVVDEMKRFDVPENGFENGVYICKSETPSIDSSAAKSSLEEKIEISSESVKEEVKLRSVCTPGRSSSLSTLAKRCRNPSDRRLPPVTTSPSQIVASEPQVGIRVGSLPLEFENLNVQTKNIPSTKCLNEHDKTDSKMTHLHAGGKDFIHHSHSTSKDNFFIDLMTAIHSSTDKESDIEEQISFVGVDSHKVYDTQEVKAKIISNISKVNSGPLLVTCSPFGEIICKEYVFHSKDFNCVPEVINSKVKPFAFDVMSPDDEVLKFRANW